MSEPNLIQTFAEIKLDMGEELGWTRTEGKWTASQVLKMNSMMDAAYRRFLFSARDPRSGMPHRWSFLEPTTTIVFWATVTGTNSGAPSYDASAYSTITATADKFYPSMIGQTYTFDTSSTDYTITHYVSATQIKVSGDASGEASGDTFTITATGDYRMPDDFGAIIGDFHYTASQAYRRLLKRVGIGQIHHQRSINSDYTSVPEIYAIVPASQDGSAGQRQNVSIWPIPASTYTLTYNYSILPDKISSSSPYPKGTEAYSEAIRWACLAEVESRHDLQRGYEQRYQDALASAVQRDQLDSMPDTVGYNDDGSTSVNRYWHDRTVGATITRNGTPI